MNVSSGLTYRDTDDNFRKVSVSLGYGDLVRIVDEGRVEGFHIEEADEGVKIVDEAGERITVQVSYRVLQAEADVLLWWQVTSEGGAAVEFAKAKIEAARGRARILR
jgi:hypothetical protein